jgi:hypothetical protein
MMKTAVTLAVVAAILAVPAGRADSVYWPVDVAKKEAGAVVALETAPITAGSFLFTPRPRGHLNAQRSTAPLISPAVTSLSTSRTRSRQDHR